MMSTTEAKKSFDLTTSDISQIQGFRRPHGSWGGGNTLTLYYHSDLVAASVRRHGQETFDKRVPEGRQMSGEAAKEKAVAATKEQEQAQISSDNAAYAVVPVDRLGNVKMYTLQKILVRLEGGKKKPFASKKDDVVQRIIAAGYSTEAEAKQMVLQKARDEAEAAKIAKERAARLAEQQRKDAISAAKVAEMLARMDKRMAQYAAGALSIDQLEHRELIFQLKLLKCPANGSKVVQ